MALLLLGTFAPVRITPPDPPPAVSLIHFQPVPVEAGRPDDLRVGKLLFLGGWNMESNDWRFGGISAMHVDGGLVTAISDSGWLIRFPVPVAAGTQRARIEAVRKGSGAPVNKAQRDVESLIINGRTAWIGLERQNGVWRFALPEWRELGGARPAAMRKWEENNGPEAMVRLPDGRFIIFSEGDGGITEALMFPSDPSVPGARAIRMRYRPPAGYRITDATLLPDGRMLLLNRRISFVSGMKAKLAVAPVPPPRTGVLIAPQEIAAFAPPLTVDNMEAVSVTSEAGRTIVWLASDDNYMPLQRSLLLKFALEE
ncbi:esterase-like activity of phytase family protein [Sphingosinicella sp. BN140058]|uniref:esterase-like activity of phytase family protein n=1 Tax=Sphingosinicella sp. BN140058 TaxID=1892855 RepID=UPI0010132A84|nr:esterase-like activity of phytase family protein [Sphingosinicella sp. BN140058]QAY77082.1 esterase-like activity of phytase family protein [Sphingosinicella sp. BN140058]